MSIEFLLTVASIVILVLGLVILVGVSIFLKLWNKSEMEVALMMEED